MEPTAYEEVGDARRAELIVELSKIVGEGRHFDAGLWACVWLSDVEKLQALVRLFSDSDKLMRKITFRDKDWARVLRTWAARDHSVQSKKRKSEAGASEDLGGIRKSSSRAKPGPAEDVAMVAPSDARSSIEKSTPAARATPATPGTPITPTEGSSEARRYIRSAAKVQKCRVRDSNLCLLTETWNCTEVAHIYPFSLGTKAGSDEHEEFWERLSYFWSTERIERWQKAIFGNEGTEILENLMCLAPTVHALWGTCRFAIKPINLSDDKKVLKVQFFWLSVGKYTPRNPQAPPTAPTNTFSSAEGTGLIHKLSTQAPQLIRSGDMMIFRTDDPENFPLPSIELLDMQWALHRATALSGAAEVTDEDFDADDGLGLAPPISVDEGAAMILSKLEREEGDDEYEEENEEEDDKGQAAQEEFAVESTTTAAASWGECSLGDKQGQTAPGECRAQPPRPSGS